jgi:hypothetical protein
MDADLESQAADYMAGNDLWLYGPNARDVLDVLDRLEDVGPEDGGAIAAAWVALPKSDREAARKGARKIVEQELELGRQVRMAREEVGAWLAVAAEYPEFVKAVPDWARICSQVGESALDAVTAIILEDELEEPHYQDLISPWTDAIAELQVEADLEEIEGVVEDEEAEPDEEEAEGEFGPNSDGVVDFLNRLWLLSPEQITRLVSGWENAPAEDLEAAHESLHAITDEDEVARDQVQRAQERITPWLNGGRLTETAGFMGQTGQSTSRRMAGPTLADACAALVVGDLLPVEDAEALYAPWFNLIGAPALPAPAPDAGDTEMDGAKS